MSETLRVSLPLKAAVGVVLVASLAIGVRLNILAESQGANRPDIADFNVFMLVGRMAWSGTLAQAYAFKTMVPLEQALGGRDTFMPWSYPPAFDLLLAPLAVVPLGPALVVFAASTLGLFLVVLRRLGGDGYWPVLLATLPSVFINLRSGQNGLLMAGLLGLAALCLLARRPGRAGAAIACLAIKPHLALTMPLLLVMEREWRAIVVAAFGVVLITGLSVAILGPGVFLAFLGTFGEVGRFMALGVYPLHRMTSVYAFLVSFGVPSLFAIAVHGVVAMFFLLWTGRILLRTDAPRIRIGLAIMSTAFVSPYFYDYDLTVFGMGLVMVAPTLCVALPVRRYAALLGGVAAAQTLGILCDALGFAHALAAPVLVVVFFVLLRTIERAAPAPSRSGAPASGSWSAALPRGTSSRFGGMS